MLDNYEKQLRQTNLAENTITSYRHSLKQYIEMYDGVFTKKNLLSFKGFLIEKYSPKTVNLRILAINKYLGQHRTIHGCRLDGTSAGIFSVIRHKNS